MRIRINKLEPKAYNIMLLFDEYLKSIELKPIHRELIKVRASQINKCAFCLDLHTKEALSIGEQERRIFLLDTWEEVPQLFSEEERIILKMTEEITLISNGLSDETYNKAMAIFSENYVAQIIMAITIINAWNRIGVSTNLGEVLKP